MTAIAIIFLVTTSVLVVLAALIAFALILEKRETQNLCDTIDDLSQENKVLEFLNDNPRGYYINGTTLLFVHNDEICVATLPTTNFRTTYYVDKNAKNKIGIIKEDVINNKIITQKYVFDKDNGILIQLSDKNQKVLNTQAKVKSTANNKK